MKHLFSLSFLLLLACSVVVAQRTRTSNNIKLSHNVEPIKTQPIVSQPPVVTCVPPTSCETKSNNINVRAFNWTSLRTVNYYQQVATPTPLLAAFHNPFFHPGCGDNSNIISFCNTANPDFLPSNGWEFLHANLGSPVEGVKHPSFTLYNRFTGIVRVFVLLTEQTLGQVALITMENTSPQRTAILSNYVEGESFALNEFNKVPFGIKPAINNLNVISPLRWVHADFKMAYDPCTCNLDSDLEFSVVIINKSYIITRPDQNPNPFIRDSFKTSSNIGLPMSRYPIASFMGNAAERLWYLRNMLGRRGDSSSLTDIITRLPIVDGRTSLAKMIWTVASPNQSPIFIKFDAALRQKIFDSGKNSPIMIIDEPKTIENWKVRTPGSENSSSIDIERTHYQNVLGVFNLLEAPLVQRRDIYNINDDRWIAGVLLKRLGFNEIQCQKPIQYIVNPAANVCVSDLEATYIVEYADSVREESASFPLSCFTDFKFVPARASEMFKGPDDSDFSTGTPPIKIFVKVSGLITPANGASTSVQFAEIFNVSLTNLDWWDSVLTQSTFPTNCSGVQAPADATRVAQVCISNGYRRGSGISGPRRDDENGSTSIGRESQIVIKTAPNPVDKTLVIKYHTPQSDANTTINLLNITGQIVATIPTPEGSFEGEHTAQYDASNLVNGIYLLRIKFGNKYQTSKIVVAH
jgi:hypothetical protein